MYNMLIIATLKLYKREKSNQLPVLANVMCESGLIRLEWADEEEPDYVMETAENSITEIIFAHTMK